MTTSTDLSNENYFIEKLSKEKEEQLEKKLLEEETINVVSFEEKLKECKTKIKKEGQIENKITLFLELYRYINKYIYYFSIYDPTWFELALILYSKSKEFDSRDVDSRDFEFIQTSKQLLDEFVMLENIISLLLKKNNNFIIETILFDNMNKTSLCDDFIKK